ncbi:uncharacterized protein LOC134814301 [Bolinopsis microptera]|uniref:uncharacterized protein LOC134814301 n=1 Tax=Bolinopsis microptera TaxID=2820187 RepID=UPI0030799EF0
MLPDLEKIEEQELRRKLFYEEDQEAKRKSPRLVSAGISGLFGLFGTTSGGIVFGGRVFGDNSVNEIPGQEYFETGEHDDEEVTLKILGKIAPDKNLLILPNGIKLTYGEIIGFAGDFYGIPEWPICAEVNGTSYKSRFMDAFNTLGRGDVSSIRKELSQIQHILMIEKNSVATVLGQGDPSIPTVLDKNKTYNQPSDVYRHHGLWFTIQYDTILGGYWVNGIPVKFGRMMKLAENNPDHFQPYSRKVWEAGHRIALQKAEEARLVFRARREEAMGLLNEAYAISAFSCHFLTDSFSAGHIRVPRVELPAVVTPEITGDLLVHYQHDEDGKFGLNVINDDKEKWRCFGDGTLYDQKSKENKRLVRGVVQECVDQVWRVFNGGPSGGVEKILRKIPNVDSAMPNNFPLFTSVSENGNLKVFRRKDVNDLSDFRKTDNWYGWSTLALLKYSYDPQNSVV